MAVNISQYQEPGVTVKEQIVQPLPGFVGLPRQVCLIGEGSTCKRFVNEHKVRGYIDAEVVTVDQNTRRFDLDHFSDSKKSTMSLFKNGDLQVAESFSIVDSDTIEIASGFFDATAAYTFSYQSTVGLNALDALAGDVTGTCGNIERVGSFPGTNDFVKGVDYTLVTSGILWQTPAAPQIDGSLAQTFSGLVGTDLRLTVNGGSEVVVPFVAGDFAAPSAATATEVKNKLNSSITGLNASAASNKVRLSTTAVGLNATIQVGNGSANSILGFMTGQFARGAGSNPAQGEEFYVTYTGARPSTDFNRPILHTTVQAALAQVGDLAGANALALACVIAFEQNPPFIFTIQAQNTGTGVAAQDLDYVDAVNAATLNPDITDIVVLGHPTTSGGGTKPLVRQAVRTHVTSESSLLEKAERYGWFGMPVGTVAGDGETPGTFLYVATQEMAVFADSPAHGRFVLAGPSFMRKTYRFPDGTVRQLRLDGTYLAVAAAAENASHLSPSDGSLRKSLVGIDDVETFDKTTRKLLSSNGVNMIINKAGNIEFVDPVSTDLSSAEFREINVMNQKDNCAKIVRKNLDASLVGVVPDDLNQFIFEVKSNIAVSLNALIAQGAIAPFQNDDGTRRPIDLTTDITVSRRADDPTTYDFNFFFFVKFVAKRLNGTYSVNVPSGA